MRFGPGSGERGVGCGRGLWALTTSLAVLQMDGHLSMMHIHVFATYFGLMVAWSLSRCLNERVMEEKNQTAKSSSLFAMLGEDKVGGGVGGGSHPWSEREALKWLCGKISLLY